MATIDYDAIRNKLEAFASSPKGQERMKKTYNKYVRNNIGKTEAGSRVFTRNDMKAAAVELISLMESHASACGVPDSVLAHFGSLKATSPKGGSDGIYYIDISFGDDLFRPSLDPGKYGGVSNIVAIFNNGYPKDGGRAEAISHVTGWWHGKNTTALGQRPGLYFMQSAVNEFNEKYAKDFDIYAELAGVYDSE